MDSATENLWHYFDGTTTFGPFSTSTIRQLIASSVIKRHYQLRREGDEAWKPLDESEFQSTEGQTTGSASVPGQGHEIPAYYLAKDGKSVGPFPTDEIRRRLTAGELCQTDLLWKEGFTEWKLISEIAEFNSVPPRNALPVPPPLPPPAKPSRQTNQPGLKGKIIAASVIGFLVIFLLSNRDKPDSGSIRDNQKTPEITSADLAWLTSTATSNSRSASPGSQTCPRCRGTGSLIVSLECDRCRGQGTTITPSGYALACTSCSGTGRRPMSCGDCGGTGQIR